jgi:hypothetical protein
MPRRIVSRSLDGFKVYVSPTKSPLKLVRRKSPRKTPKTSPRKTPKKRLPLRNITNVIHNMARDGMFHEFQTTTPVFTYRMDRFMPEINNLIRSPQIKVSKKNAKKKKRKTRSKKRSVLSHPLLR